MVRSAPQLVNLAKKCPTQQPESALPDRPGTVPVLYWTASLRQKNR